MSHTYLLDTYAMIARRLKEIEVRLDSEVLHDCRRQLLQGQFQALKEFQNYLECNYHEKLPRRIRERLTKKKTA